MTHWWWRQFLWCFWQQIIVPMAMNISIIVMIIVRTSVLCSTVHQVLTNSKSIVIIVVVWIKFISYRHDLDRYTTTWNNEWKKVQSQIRFSWNTDRINWMILKSAVKSMLKQHSVIMRVLWKNRQWKPSLNHVINRNSCDRD